jgi:hypothetical protein
VALPPQPPQLTPEAALALLRVLLKARAARGHQRRTRAPAGTPAGDRPPVALCDRPRGEGMTMADTTIRFASWGRVSTEDRQDPESSRAWQYARGKALIEPHGGVIVAEFFDIDKSRSIPPQRRPEASKLLAALTDAHQGFMVVVVGEPQVDQQTHSRSA